MRIIERNELGNVQIDEEYGMKRKRKKEEVEGKKSQVERTQSNWFGAHRTKNPLFSSCVRHFL